MAVAVTGAGAAGGLGGIYGLGSSLRDFHIGNSPATSTAARGPFHSAVAFWNRCNLPRQNSLQALYPTQRFVGNRGCVIRWDSVRRSPRRFVSKLAFCVRSHSGPESRCRSVVSGC